MNKLNVFQQILMNVETTRIIVAHWPHATTLSDLSAALATLDILAMDMFAQVSKEKKKKEKRRRKKREEREREK